MPPRHADEQGYNDGLHKAPKAPSRCGYPPEYDAAYRRGLLERSRLRRALDQAARSLANLAEKT